MGIELDLLVDRTAADDWICFKCEQLLKDPVRVKILTTENSVKWTFP